MESLNDNYECECKASSMKRKSYLNVFDSDEESSSDKSKKIRSVDTKPPSKAKDDNCTGYFVESERGTDKYEEDCTPKAQGSYSSVGIQKAAQSDYKNSDDYHCETSHKSEYQTSNWKAATASPDPRVAECARRNATRDWPIFPAIQPPPESRSIQKADLYWRHEEQHAQAHPLIRAAWEGAFAVYDEEEYTSAKLDGFKGCVSSKACASAQLMLEQLPPTIIWEKLPRRCLWPKSFERRDGPTGDDIAIFFFPSVTKHESEYDSLVFDLIREDTALRTSVMESELLLFTSVELPPLFTRFQGNFYLWGVFKGTQPPS